MNRQQKDYAIAKAVAEAADEQQRENEKRFLVASGVKNDDGSTPTSLWMIDNEDDFLRLAELWDNSNLNKIELVRETAKMLFIAEEALIDYALSIVPSDIAKTLNEHRRDYSTRQKMLDLAFRLDTRTVK